MFKGSLKTTSLADVLRLLCASAQTGELRLEAEGYEARMSLRLGRILHAEAGEEAGLDALRSICGRLDAAFTFVAGAEARGRSLEEYPSASIIDSVKSVVDHDRQLRKAMPAAGDVVLFQSHYTGNLEAGPEELQLLLLADGTRTVADLAAQSGLPLADTMLAIARHALAGVLAVYKAEAEEPGTNEEQPPGAVRENAPARFWRGKRVN